MVAVRKYQQKSNEKIGDIKLSAGDTLLLLVKKDFIQKWKNHFHDDFFIVSEIDTPIERNRIQQVFPIAVLIGMIVLASFNYISMFKAALIVTFSFIVTNIVKPNKILKDIDFQVLLLIACSFGIGIAIENTGLAQLVANYLVKFAGEMGIIGILIAIYFITNVLTELITNSAAVVIMFPIGIAISEQLMVDPFVFIITLTIAASASFSTPIGYQTNLIVYSQGKYQYKDFLKTGLPLSAIYMIITVTIVYLFIYS
ncbi:SLC13 family permease [Oceanobacillus halophilus]|uniref:Citrate transporter-like domain-containing protein n=1 Tax=Oceanobacillus halophilus TaxID=930130 RepID=A0A495A1N6_9BACI|nr:SLC13 family permease [Oceanobacillus halophilus]RKQ32668.1 hypothetical protein D8M06_12090 [Oceanobacillus halophilus]